MRLCAELLDITLQQDLHDAGYLGQVFPDSSIRQLTMHSLSKSLLKKFHNDEQSDQRDQAALTLFLECNQRCGNLTSVVPQRLDEELVLGELKVALDKFFVKCVDEPDLLSVSAISKHFGLGNGSNIGAPNTDFYSKLVLSDMSHVDGALPPLFEEALRVDKLWHDVEVSRARAFGYRSVNGSRLSFVPKSRTISRTIATEPVLNMLFQKGIGGVLESRLRQVYGIDLSLQPDRNARLAREGSRTGRFGTIDLSSASDSISITLIRTILPEIAQYWLFKTRSPVTILPDGSEVELHMISSMGNGYTFPLQTTIFAALVQAVYKVMDIPFIRPCKLTDGNFAVFGDDIIVVKEAYNLLTRCLAMLGFTVNLDKSFNEGSFRESCGHDYVCGYNVRGVYIKTLRNDGDAYSAINRLLRWSAKHGIFLPRTITALRHGRRFIGVPFYEADDSGIKVPLSLLRTIRRDPNGAIKYRALVSVPRVVRIPSVAVDAEISHQSQKELAVTLRRFRYDSDGLLLCLVAGWLRSGQLGLRSQTKKTVLRHRKSPGWDPCDADLHESVGSADRWKATVELSLVS